MNQRNVYELVEKLKECEHISLRHAFWALIDRNMY